MENPSIYDVFERMWQHILAKFNNYVLSETLNGHIEDKNNPHGVTAEQIGFTNVDNTSDIDKPISNAMQVALDEKANIEHIHDASNITSGILGVEHGGTGYNSIVDTTYTTARYRASTLNYTETIPADNGIINWMYE